MFCRGDKYSLVYKTCCYCAL